MGAILLASLGHSIVADRLLRPLESQYPAWAASPEMPDDPSRRGRADHSAKWVVVLGGGYSSDPQLPVTSRLSGAALARLVEGIGVHQQLPGSKLLRCLAGRAETDGEAQDIIHLATALGVRPADINLIRGARDTEEEIAAIERTLGSDAFVLVTSASHMPRAMALAQAQGLNPVAAPTDHRARWKHWNQPADLFPDAEGVRGSERAVYEYLGGAWARLRTKF